MKFWLKILLKISILVVFNFKPLYGQEISLCRVQRNPPRGYYVDDSEGHLEISLKEAIFEPGTVIFIVCRPGYSLSESNNNRTTCLSYGAWTPDLLDIAKCIKSQSVTLRPIATRSTPTTTATTASMTTTEEPVQGSSTAKPSYCFLPKRENGFFRVVNRVSTNDNRAIKFVRPGARVQLNCTNGTELVDGTDRAYCDNQFRWSRQFGYCKRTGTGTEPPATAMPTEKPPVQEKIDCLGSEHLTIENGNVTGSGNVREIECQPGYVIVGQQRVTCRKDGQWSLPGQCISEDQVNMPCESLPQLENALIIGKELAFPGEQREVRCNETFVLEAQIGDESSGVLVWPSSAVWIRCRSNRKWSKWTGRCSPVCEHVPEVVNGYIADGPSVVGGVRSVRCSDSSHFIIGADEITCCWNLNWTNPGQCQSKKDVPLSSHVFVSIKEERSGQCPAHPSVPTSNDCFSIAGGWTGLFSSSCKQFEPPPPKIVSSAPHSVRQTGAFSWQNANLLFAYLLPIAIIDSISF